MENNYYDFTDCPHHNSSEIIDWINDQEDFGNGVSDAFWNDVKKKKASLDYKLLEMLYLYFPEERDAQQVTNKGLESFESLEASAKEKAQDEIFTNTLIKDEKFQKVPLALLDDYHNNIFSPQDDETFSSLVESIRINGVREPILVLEKSNGRYEILAGHNRIRACKDLGYQDIKALIFKDLSEEEAEGIYIESNLIRKDKSQRLPSELAKVYASYSNLKKVLGKRYDEIRVLLLSGESNDEDWVRDRDVLAHELGISSRSIANYVRLNKLDKHLLKKVDTKKISLMVGVELSFLSNQGQVWVNEILEDYEEAKVTLKRAKALRNLPNNASYEDYKKVILGKKTFKWSLKLNEDFLSNFFDVGEDEKVMKKAIRQALKQHYFKK